MFLLADCSPFVLYPCQCAREEDVYSIMFSLCRDKKKTSMWKKTPTKYCKMVAKGIMWPNTLAKRAPLMVVLALAHTRKAHRIQIIVYNWNDSHTRQYIEHNHIRLHLCIRISTQSRIDLYRLTLLAENVYVWHYGTCINEPNSIFQEINRRFMNRDRLQF